MMTDDIPLCSTCLSLKEAACRAYDQGDYRKFDTMTKLYQQHRAQHKSERESESRIHQLWPNAKVRG